MSATVTASAIVLLGILVYALGKIVLPWILRKDMEICERRQMERERETIALYRAGTIQVSKPPIKSEDEDT